MISIDIYAILQSRPHNPHYLNRYWKFIQYCIENPPNDEYLEEHHICPKASDMFPEYAELQDHHWNSIRLQARRHIIAHVMLWKAYKNASQTSALNYMLNVQNQNTISFNKRVVPTSLSIRYAAKAREEYYELRKGTAVYKIKKEIHSCLIQMIPEYKKKDQSVIKLEAKCQKNQKKL